MNTLGKNREMSKIRDNLIEVFYLVLGSVLGIIGTIFIKILIIAPESLMVIVSSIVIAGVLFGLYKILVKLAKGSLIRNILVKISKFYQRTDFK